MKRKSNLCVGVSVVTVVVVLTAVQVMLQTKTTAQAIQAGVPSGPDVAQAAAEA